MSVLTGVVGAGLSTLGNLLGNGISYSQQKSLAADQFNYNKQLMQMQMDYNNPVHQMSMYRAAGINPNAVLGNNTSVTGSSVGQGTAPIMPSLGSDLVKSFYEGYQSDSQKESLIANSRAALSNSKALDADTLKKLSETKGLSMQNDILASQAKDFKDKIALDNALTRSQIAQAETSSVLTELQSLKQLQENKLYSKVVNQEVAESVARVKLLAAEGRLTAAQTKLAIANTLMQSAQTQGIRLNNKTAAALALDYIEQFGAQTDLIKAKKNYINKQDSWYDSQAVSSMFTNLFKFGK